MVPCLGWRWGRPPNPSDRTILIHTPRHLAPLPGALPASANVDHDAPSLSAEAFGAPSAPWVRSFLLALLVYVALRAWILMTAFEAVAIPVYEIPTIGSYGWALSEGVPLLPWGEYYDNAGAQLLTAWLSSVSYGLFGASYLALKLVPMAFGVLLLAMVGRMLSREFSARAAWIGMLSVAIAPPIVTKYSMLAKGNHFEGLTLLFVALLAALETPEPGHPRRRWWVAFTGAALGFSVSMYFGALLTGVVLAVAWWMRFGAARSLRDLPAMLGGLAVGLIPLVLINLGTEGRAQRYGLELGSPMAGQSADGVLAKGYSLLVDTLPQAACFESVGGWSPRVAETVFLIATILAWLTLAGDWARTFIRADDVPTDARRRRRAALWILLAYPIGVLGVLTLKGLPIMPKTPPVEVLGVRYLLGYFFFSLLLLAVAIDRLWGAATRMPRSVGWLLALALSFTWPFTAAIGSLRWTDRHDAAVYPGVHMRQYSILFRRDLRLGEPEGVDTSRMKACLRRLSDDGWDDQRAELAMGIGAFLTLATLGYQGRGGADELSIEAITLDFDPQDHPNLLRGVGMFFQSTARGRRLAAKGGKPSLFHRQVLALMEDRDAAPWIAEGFGMAQQYPLLRRLPSEVRKSRNLLRVIPEDLRESTLKGLARSMDHYRDLRLARAESVIQDEVSKFSAEDQATLRGFLDSPATQSSQAAPNPAVRPGDLPAQR